MADVLTPDLCIIGAGAGGIAAARAARRLGASVVLVERVRMGGARLNTACIPGAAFMAAATQAQQMRTASRFGIADADPHPVFRQVHEHVHGVMDILAPADSIEQLTALGVDLIAGEARFAAPRLLKVDEVGIRAKRYIIATGSRPEIPSIPGLDDVPYFTTDTIVENTRKLTHLLVVGAGPVGLELAQAHRRLGSDVTVVDSGDPVLSGDPELSAIALERIAAEGVDVLGGTTILGISLRSMGIGVRVRTGEIDRQLDVSHILVATGRLPNIETLDLDKARIRLARADGPAVLRNAGMETSNPRVLLIGDAVGAGVSTLRAVREARLAVERALLGRRPSSGADLVPVVTHTDPEIAEIGLTEAQARTAGRAIHVVRASFAENARARTRRDAFGLAKLLLDPSGRILGAGIVGSGAGETVSVLSAAMAGGLAADDLADLPIPQPTLAEIVVALGEAWRRDRPLAPATRRRLAMARWLR